ncbi:acyl-CoA dehydratase activase [Desulfosporosinus sp. PR]|uniref:acyl-CoA dehydratase activase n=1 Tax=Candidatus Desulfosporosinus nitrosoreducens TaxID=3401928 RepID=UPI0027FC1A90|nr:acyl-CoA dehydratase activase [Desulfosporosinus sp. PR]MDQ7092170.1 acyl-CoA dehydratase activase [Desulfosporosinus sp. PR]
MIHYVCKYTPLELFAGFSAECAILDNLQDNFEVSDRVAHANLCGFGKAVIQAALSGQAGELVLVNCCDTMRRAYDVIKKSGACHFLYLLDLPHQDSCCQQEILAGNLLALKSAYAEYSGQPFDPEAFRAAFSPPRDSEGPYIGIFGARAGQEIEEMIRELLALPLRNLTCVGNRSLAPDKKVLANTCPEAEVFLIYAGALLAQLPCLRMSDTAGRRSLYNDPNLRGAIYHTIKFCDFYGFEYAELKNKLAVPLLKLETDYTRQSKGQLQTRIEAFAETLSGLQAKQGNVGKGRKMSRSGQEYVAGIDSGSTSTDVVILAQDKTIAAALVIPTGGSAQTSAEKSLAEALHSAGIARSSVSRVVTTGYGRAYIDGSDESITEITCHAKGAHYLNPATRTIIDIGGQDSKVIRIDDSGAVMNFVMNDKCAAGTGRFLEMMARTLGLTLGEMSKLGLNWREDIVISSMCTVFAESEVVSLIAQNKAVPDIIHGLNNSVAAKVSSLITRLGPEGGFILTGGVAQNLGVVRALEVKLGIKLYICGEAQLCGALGAALFALE